MPKVIIPKPVSISLILLGFLTLLFFGSTHLLFSWDGVREGLEEALQEGLTSYGLGIEITQVRPGPGSTFILEEVGLTLPEGSGQAKIPEVMVYYSWTKLLTNWREPAKALVGLRFVRPDVRVNYSTIGELATQPSQGQGLDLVSSLAMEATDGKLSITGIPADLSPKSEKLRQLVQAFGYDPAQGELELTNLDFSVYAEASGKVSVSTDFVPLNTYLRNFSILAEYSGSQGWTLEIASDNAIIDGVSQLISEEYPQLKLDSGKFSGTVYLTGTPDFSDLKWSASLWLHRLNGRLAEPETRFTNLQGGLLLGPELINIQSLQANLGTDQIQVQGLVGLTSPVGLDLRLTGQKIDLSQHRGLWEGLPLAEYIENLTGRVDLDLTINGTLADPVLAGRVNLAQTEIELDKPVPMVVSEVGGEIALAGDRIWTEGINLRLADQPMVLKGQLLLGGTPNFDLNLSTQPVGLGKLVSWLDERGLASVVPSRFRNTGSGPLQGEVAFSGTILGPINSPLVAGSLTLNDGLVAGVPVESFVADFDYLHQTFNIRKAELVLPENQSLTGSLQYRLRDQNYSGIITYENLDIPWLYRHLPAFPEFLETLEGEASGDLVLSGNLKTQAFPRIAGNLELTDFSFQGEPLDYFRANWSFEQGLLGVEVAEILGEWGAVTGSGQYSMGSKEIEAHLFGSELDLAKIVSNFSEQGENLGQLDSLQGVASVRARLTGTVDSPKLKGSVVVREPGWKGESYDLLTGEILYTEHNLVLNQLELTEGITQVALSGQINNLLTAPVLFLDADLQDLEARLLSGVLGRDLGINGTVTGRLQIEGEWPQVTVKGPVFLPDGSWREATIEDAQADLIYQEGLIQFTGFRARIADAEVTGDGRIQDDRVNVSFEVQDASLNSLRVIGIDLPGLQGSADFNGLISGDLGSLVLKGIVQASDLKYSGYQLARAEGSFQYYLPEGRVVVDSLRMHQGESSLKAKGEITVSDVLKYNLDFDLNNTAVQDLQSVAPAWNWPNWLEIAGRTTGLIHIEGQGSDLSARALLDLHDLSYANFNYDGSLNVGYSDGLIQLYQGRLWDSETEISCSGNYRLGGEMAFEATATGVNLSQLAPVLRPEAEVEGLAAFNAKVSGRPEAPEGHLEYSLANGEAEGVSIKSSQGKLRFGPEGIELQSIRVVTGSNQTSVEGTLPWPRQVMTLIPGYIQAENEIDLHVQMEDESLALLSLFVGGPIEVSGQGLIDLTIKGNYAEPVVDGVVDLAHVKMSLPTILPGSFNDVTAKIDFAGRKAIIKQATGLFNGGNFDLSGQVGFEELSETLLDLGLKGSGVGLNYSFLDSKANVDLKITGPVKTPLIQGEAVLSDAVFKFAQGTSSRNKYTSEARLDIKVTNSNDVRILVSNIVDARAIGEVRLGGTIRDITLTGHAEATRGTITYADTVFQITGGTADFASFRGLVPVLNVQAETRVPEALVQLQVSGPTDDLQMSLVSDPPMSEQEIVTSLSLPGRLSKLIEGAREGMWEEELLRLVDDQISSQVMGGIESAVREALQLDEFRIRQAFSEENLQLQFGKYLVDNLYVTYTRTLDEEDPLEYLGFEYRLKPNIIVNNSFSSDGEIRFGVETKLRF